MICTMVLISDGKSERGARVRSNLCYLICLRQLVRSRAATNRIFLAEKIFLHTCAACSELPPSISTMVITNCIAGTSNFYSETREYSVLNRAALSITSFVRQAETLVSLFVDWKRFSLFLSKTHTHTLTHTLSLSHTLYLSFIHSLVHSLSLFLSFSLCLLLEPSESILQCYSLQELYEWFVKVWFI